MKRLFKFCWPPYPMVTLGAGLGILVCRWLIAPALDEPVPLVVYFVMFLLVILGVSGYYRWRESKKGGKKA